MKSKGFTLIELLAVIVVLAIIALIAVPMILGVVEKSKKGAAVSSAYGYIDAVEKYMLLHTLDSTKYPVELMPGETYQVSSKEFRNNSAYLKIVENVYAESNIHINDFISIKGNKPSSGIITIGNKNTVSNAKLITNGYLVECNNKKCEVKRKVVVDNTPPVISNVTVTPDSKKITISYNVEDKESGVETVKCYYKKSSDTNYTEVATSNGVCEITGLIIKTDYDYKIESTNYDGSSSTNSGTTKTLDGACKVTQQAGSSLALGDTITCGTEAFYYIGEGTGDEADYYKLFTKNPLSSNNTQVSSGYVMTVFRNSGTAYWVDNNGNLKNKYGSSYPAYVYDSNCLQYPYVEAYVSKLNNILQVETVKGRLVNYDEIKNTFGCSRFGSSSYTCSNNSKYNLSASDFWLGITNGSSDMYLYLKSGNYATNGTSYICSRKTPDDCARGIRPVILIPKSEL